MFRTKFENSEFDIFFSSAEDMFKKGSSLACPYSALEEWKMMFKPNVS